MPRPACSPHAGPCRARRAAVAALALAAAALASACGGDAPTAAELPACAPGTLLSVTPEPGGAMLDWSPGCAVSFVAVADSATLDAAWAIRTATPTLRPPQRLFRTPPGAQRLGVGERLRPGLPYVVLLGVRHTDPASGRVGEREVASVHFTP